MVGVSRTALDPEMVVLTAELVVVVPPSLCCGMLLFIFVVVDGCNPGDGTAPFATVLSDRAPAAVVVAEVQV